MALHNEASIELVELRQKKRDIVKRVKQLKLEVRLENDIEKWQKIMDAKSTCEKVITDANLGMRMSLSKLDKFPEYYVYQHPVKRKLKTANRNAEWVQQYLGAIPYGATGGITGDEADLLAAAKKTRLSAWKRAVKKKKTAGKPMSGSSGGSGKARAVGSVGVG